MISFDRSLLWEKKFQTPAQPASVELKSEKYKQKVEQKNFSRKTDDSKTNVDKSNQHYAMVRFSPNATTVSPLNFFKHI
jgi:hypothetical protein